jgi:hypothetical protein
MRLDLNASCVQNGPTCFQNTLYFLLPIMIKGGKSTTMWTQTFLDLGASVCFIDKGLVRQHNLTLVKKVTLVIIEVINGWSLSLGPIMHETKVLMVIIGSHNSKVIFNVISSPIIPIIIGLSWLVLHNLGMDYETMSLHFELINETTPKYKLF